MAAEPPNLIQVEIFGQTYAVRAGADPKYIEQLAAYVDTQMREVAKASGAVDTMRIAVLASLNIADECFRAKNSGESGESELKQRAEKLAKTLSRVLDGTD
jgi:cell division protein ZapA